MVKVYGETVSEPIVQPSTDTLFEEEDWICQQDLALIYKSILAQEWLEENVPNFIKPCTHTTITIKFVEFFLPRTSGYTVDP